MKKNVTIRSDEMSIERWRKVAASKNQSLNAWIVNILDAETNIEDNYERVDITMPLPKDHLLQGPFVECERELREGLVKAGFHMWNVIDVDDKRHLRFAREKTNE